MSSILKNNLSKIFYILLILVSYILSEKSYTTIDLGKGNEFYLDKEEDLKVLNFSEYDYYKITIEKKIEIGSLLDHNNYLLSFYQNDSEFQNRRQFSQGKGKVEMWLNKAQVDTEFYLRVETDNNDNLFKNMSLNLEGYNFTELEIEKQFTYFVSEENKVMKFKLKELELKIIKEISPDLNNYILTIWAKGNKNVESVMEGFAPEIPSDKYKNYYRLNMTELINNFTFELTINGEINDLINVGVLIFHIEKDNEGEIYVTREIGETMDGLELTGYLKPNERVGVKYLKALFKGPLGYFADFNNNLQNLIYIGAKEEGLHIIEQFTSSEESFYTIQLPQITITKTFYSEYPQIMGVNYFRMISEKEQIGIIPMKLEDFEFLTYEVIPVGGEIEVSIFNCSNYPSCSPKKGSTKNLSDYETFSYTFRKDEWYEEISPMSKNQTMLVISCKNKINREKEYCELVTNMRTDKNIITNHFANQELHVTRYIRKGDENKYKIKEDHKIYMNVEILSGKVEITYNGEKKFEMGTQKNYL